MSSMRMNQFYKTKICPWYFKGRCERGSTCRFAHFQGELRILPNLSKTSLCPQLLKLGRCSEPGKCRFAHSSTELRATDDLYKTSLCFLWMRGRCDAGDQCRHAHGVPELRSLPGSSPNTAGIENQKFDSTCQSITSSERSAVESSSGSGMACSSTADINGNFRCNNTSNPNSMRTSSMAYSSKPCSPGLYNSRKSKKTLCDLPFSSLRQISIQPHKSDQLPEDSTTCDKALTTATKTNVYMNNNFLRDDALSALSLGGKKTSKSSHSGKQNSSLGEERELSFANTQDINHATTTVPRMPPNFYLDSRSCAKLFRFESSDFEQKSGFNMAYDKDIEGSQYEPSVLCRNPLVKKDNEDGRSTTGFDDHQSTQNLLSAIAKLCDVSLGDNDLSSTAPSTSCHPFQLPNITNIPPSTFDDTLIWRKETSGPTGIENESPKGTNKVVNPFGDPSIETLHFLRPEYDPKEWESCTHGDRENIVCMPPTSAERKFNFNESLHPCRLTHPASLGNFSQVCNGSCKDNSPSSPPSDKQTFCSRYSSQQRLQLGKRHSSSNSSIHRELSAMTLTSPKMQSPSSVVSSNARMKVLHFSSDNKRNLKTVSPAASVMTMPLSAATRVPSEPLDDHSQSGCSTPRRDNFEDVYTLFNKTQTRNVVKRAVSEMPLTICRSIEDHRGEVVHSSSCSKVNELRKPYRSIEDINCSAEFMASCWRQHEVPHFNDGLLITSQSLGEVNQYVDCFSPRVKKMSSLNCNTPNIESVCSGTDYGDLFRQVERFDNVGDIYSSNSSSNLIPSLSSLTQGALELDDYRPPMSFVVTNCDNDGLCDDSRNLPMSQEVSTKCNMAQDNRKEPSKDPSHIRSLTCSTNRGNSFAQSPCSRQQKAGEIGSYFGERQEQNPPYGKGRAAPAWNDRCHFAEPINCRIGSLNQISNRALVECDQHHIADGFQDDKSLEALLDNPSLNSDHDINSSALLMLASSLAATRDAAACTQSDKIPGIDFVMGEQQKERSSSLPFAANTGFASQFEGSYSNPGTGVFDDYLSLECDYADGSSQETNYKHNEKVNKDINGYDSSSADAMNATHFLRSIRKYSLDFGACNDAQLSNHSLPLKATGQGISKELKAQDFLTTQFQSHDTLNRKTHDDNATGTYILYKQGEQSPKHPLYRSRASFLNSMSLDDGRANHGVEQLGNVKGHGKHKSWNLDKPTVTVLEQSW